MYIYISIYIHTHTYIHTYIYIHTLFQTCIYACTLITCTDTDVHAYFSERGTSLHRDARGKYKPPTQITFEERGGGQEEET